MEKVLNFFKGKSIGFYINLITITFTLFTFIVFFFGQKEGYVSWGSFAFMLILILGDIALFVFKKDNFVGALNTVCSIAAIGFFINACYSYVATVMQGIDIEAFSPYWIMTVVGSVAMYTFSVATIFTPMSKKIEN